MNDLEKILKKFWKGIQKKPNVIGYSGKLKPKITRDVNGKAIEDPSRMVVRVYVTKKVDKTLLSTQDLVPAIIKDGRDEIETDVVEIGEIKALGCYDCPPPISASDASDGRADKHRPLVIGPSAMGVWTGSSACSLGGFARNKKPSEPEFIGILANNHCYPGHVEVLTRDGFKTWKDITGEEEFATLSPEGELEYHKPTRKFELEWSGKPLKKVWGHNFAISMTPGQHIYGAEAWHHSSKRMDFKLRTVEDLEHRINNGKTTTMRFKRDAMWHCDDNPEITTDIIEFLGWYISEGSACINNIGQNIISIRQREDRYYDEIYECLSRIENKVWKCKSAIVANSPRLHKLLHNIGLYGKHSKDKFIPVVIKSLPPEKLEILLNTLIKGDGSNGRHRRYFTTSNKLADDVSEIALKIGIPTNITTTTGSTNFADNRILYNVHLLKRTEPLVHGVEEYIHYGNVYDVEVPNHTLFVREGGTGVWSGNCCAHENKASKGTHYIQPSPYDGGSDPADKVGTLWRFVEIKFNGFACPYRNALHKVWKMFVQSDERNTVDIGLVKLDDLIPYNVEVHNVGAIHGKRDAMEGDTVSKFGRTTGLTTDGRVIDTDWSGSVRYSRGNVFFQDCVLITGDRFSQGGDSSSFVFTQGDQRYYIGNLFAGSDSHSIIAKGSNIEERLEVEVLI